MQLTQNKFRGWLIILMLFVGLNHCSAANVLVSWNPSSDSDVVGYNVYYGKISGSYSNKITVGNITTTAISNLNCGDTYYFTATALDPNGTESDFSENIQFIVPGILTATPGLTPGAATLIKFPVAPTHWYEVQATTDLKSWATIWQTDVMAVNAWVEFSDPQTSEFASRFYRLILH
jgi:hypothetical protein